VEPTFISTWARFTRALRQRNAALKRQPELAAVWDAELIQSGELLSNMRTSYLAAIQPYWSETVEALLDLPLKLSLVRGWPMDHSLADALSRHHARDHARGITHIGPHRADVSLRIDGRAARDVLSRGQQKLAAISLVLAQLKLINEAQGSRSTLLLDDPAAELDSEKLALFVNQLSKLRCQLIFTSLCEQIDLLGKPTKVFHVEHGGVQEL
jgi:DNA replication and repair protein RecF